MSERKPPARNPIAPQLRAGTNQPKVIPDKRKRKRVKHKAKEIEFHSD